MQDFRMKKLSFLATAMVILLLLCSNAKATINAHYLYTFSDFTGKIPYTWPSLSIDRERGEIYVINQGSVSVFNSVGMEESSRVLEWRYLSRRPPGKNNRGR
jgi:hypothetical protein